MFLPSSPSVLAALDHNDKEISGIPLSTRVSGAIARVSRKCSSEQSLQLRCFNSFVHDSIFEQSRELGPDYLMSCDYPS